jgi:hypothetical protein
MPIRLRLNGCIRLAIVFPLAADRFQARTEPENGESGWLTPPALATRIDQAIE